jgi:murein DD-endopeptidase MepM/ murein hydrolase activator NlpD
LDFATPTSEPIFAMQDGMVSEIRPASNGNPYGNCVVIAHEVEGIHYRTFYAHLLSCSVSVGQMVTKGQQVGRADSTGNSSGPHLHITVKVVGFQASGWPPEYCDPLLLLVQEEVPPVEGEVWEATGNMIVRTDHYGTAPKAPFAEWLKPGDRRTIVEKVDGWGRFGTGPRWVYTLSPYMKRIS